ncbi:reeler domain containing 1 [Anarhichas minor]|uniref:reeler domain containing 1 n=1 Tax=Anarhichas minor TaxID=65739 RepID=UPI003F73937E
MTLTEIKRETLADPILQEISAHIRHNPWHQSDAVLHRQPKHNKLTTPYNSKPYTVTKVKGSMITAARNGHFIVRNSSFFEKITKITSPALTLVFGQKMQSPLRCFGVGVVLFSLAPSTLTFSRGAGHASCRDMIPGHIRAQPRDPKRVHVALRTSASSYLPGQFVTVTVQSSRDFMGFLLQARSVEGPGVGARTGARSTSVAPELVGGSWTLTPPGTHTLRCLSEDDTLTHSDKQLKRNLSFVWRAPEGPMGDIRFYITVVQSYFVYWAGIESAVVTSESHTSLIKDEKGRQSVPRTQNLHLKPSLHSQTSSTKPLLHSQTGPSHIFPFFQEPSSMSRTSLSFILPSKTPTLQSFVKTQTTPPLSQAYSLSIHTTSPHPEPSPAPRRSLYNPLTSSTTSSPIPSKQLTLGQRLPIQNHIESSDTEPNLNLQTPRTVVHPNPERHPNLDPNFDLNLGHMLKPNIPKTDTKPKPPSKPPGTPDKEGKYPDINARHSAWELGMLLGCSAGLGMVLVVGVRYMCRQACGKQTEVTLNDRETEYGRGERGLLHVQECGDLVRVRRIRENSFVLLAEYDVLPSPGD